ncbi:hypothetical protein VKT23_019121 [Stygiomarasmius scandens]|uniref:Uncharacterized protein n=1 Tax=Marasmiellus scandens TaxID=2682957 RepID=A0ABR1IMD0_9AGAR
MDAEVEKDAFYFLRGLDWKNVVHLAHSSADNLNDVLPMFESFYNSLVGGYKSEPVIALALRAMLQKKIQGCLGVDIRPISHEQWYLNTSEAEKLEKTGLIWTPDTKLPPVNVELNVVHACSSKSGRKRTRAVSESREEGDEYRDAHIRHKRKTTDISPTVATSHGTRPISFDPLSSSRRMHSYEEKVSVGVALATHDCLQEPPVADDSAVLFGTDFILRGKDLAEDVEYDESHKLVCTQCIVRGLKCTETVKILGKDTGQCHNCYKSHAAISCSLREPGSAQFQQVQAEYLAGYSKGNFRALNALSAILRHTIMTCLVTVRTCEQSWTEIERKMKDCSHRIVKAAARSKEEVDFIVETVPVVGYILTTVVGLVRDASGPGGDSAHPRPQVRARVSSTPLIDAGKLLVEQLVGPSVPCSACVLERLRHRGAVTHLRTSEAVCSHEEFPSTVFEQAQTEYMEGYSSERITDVELQECLQEILRKLAAYSRGVDAHRKARAGLEQCMAIFAEHVTAAALRSSEELDFHIQRVPFLGWVVDVAGRVHYGYPLEAPPVIQETEQKPSFCVLPSTWNSQSKLSTVQCA